MNIFKKIFKKRKKEKEPECWYNNFHQTKKRRGQTIENADPGSGIDSALESKMFFISSSH